jgi:UDP-4-amino-4-deoxy-L-arabinose-oxoglutarate aminotransferase
MTFIATSTAIMHTGAKPVFVDVEPDTGLINPELVESAVTKKTKAILPVHLYGQMCDMIRLRDIADKYNLKIIEDSAHCIEAERDGIRPGALSDVACFSFYATKNITSGEGGAIGTNSNQLAERVRMLRQHGMTKEAADRYSGHYQHWDMLECGWKCNMDNIQASLLLPQLKKIDLNWKKRNELYEKYVKSINDIPGVGYPKILANSKSALHLFTIWVDADKRDSLLHLYGENDIGVAVNYRAIHLLKFFKDTFGFTKGAFPEAERIGSSTLSLPFYPRMTDSEIEEVFRVLELALR